MKRFIYILMMVMLVFTVFTACGNRPGNLPAPPPPPPPPQASPPQSSRPADPPQIHSPRNYTPDEAAAHNAALRDSDVRLIQFEEQRADAPIATIDTSAGRIRVVLYPEHAPKAVENFITHSRNGYYNGMSFSRVIRNFLIQSGAPNDGEPVSVFGEPFESEYSLDLWNFRGALVMVNSGAHRPDTNTSEFMIIQAGFVSESTIEAMKAAGYPQKVIDKYAEVGGVPGFDWRNTVFGMVIEGMNIVDTIAASETDAMNNPIRPVIISSITIRD